MKDPKDAVLLAANIQMALLLQISRSKYHAAKLLIMVGISFQLPVVMDGCIPYYSANKFKLATFWFLSAC